MATLRASKSGLKIVDQYRKKKGWNKQQKAWYELANSSKPTLKRFWQGINIQHETFIAICEAVGIKDWESISEINQPSVALFSPKNSISPNVYKQSIWVERRDSEISELQNKLKDKTQVLCLTGISGVGKTALAEYLAVQSWQDTNSFHWISLEILESQNPDFVISAEKILADMGVINLNQQERNDPKLIGDRLISKLQSHSYWIQLDSIERLLKTEDSNFIDSYWVTFFQQFLSANFSSRLILTSQVLPNPMLEFVDRYPHTWHTVRLAGLSTSEEHSEQLEFFYKTGIPNNDSNSTLLSKIGEIYEGHPLALQVISGEIRQDYNNDVAQYWEINRQEFEQLTREISSERLNPALYNEELQRRIRRRIENSLRQLPNNALNLLCRSSVYRSAVPKLFWLKMLWDIPDKQIQQAFLQLRDRALIEKEGTPQNQNLIRQHNLIRDIAYDLLIADTSTWKTAQYKAAELWLKEYKPGTDKPNLDQVRGYLEAFYHYYEIKEYKKCHSILVGQGWGVLIQIWSYSQELIPLYSSLIDKLDEETNLICYKALGNAYSGLGTFNKAIEWYQKSLDVSIKIKNKLEQGEILNNIGICLKNLRDYDKAIKIYFDSLKISIQEKDQRLRARVLGNIGNIYNETNRYTDAIKYQHQALRINESLLSTYPDAIHGYSIELGNLGNIYHDIGNYKAAIKYQLSHLEISRKIGDRQGEGRALMRLGRTYYAINEVFKAIQNLKQSLTISKKIEDSKAQLTAWETLSNIYIDQEKYSKAIECCHSRLKILYRINDPHRIAHSLLQIGSIWLENKEYDRAAHFCHESLNFYQELYDDFGTMNALFYLGTIEYNKSSYVKAINYYNQSLNLSKRTFSLDMEATVLSLLGFSYFQLDGFDRAEEFFLEHLRIANKTNNDISRAAAYANLARFYSSISDHKKAILNLENQLNLSVTNKDRKGKISAISGLAVVNFKIKNYLNSLCFWNDLLEYHEQDSIEKSKIYFEIANIYHITKQYNPAYEYCKKALCIANRMKDISAKTYKKLLLKIESDLQL